MNEWHERAVELVAAFEKAYFARSLMETGKTVADYTSSKAALFAAIAAPPPPAAVQEPVDVKALEWEICGTKSSYHGGPYDKAWSWSAKGAGLFYQIITQPEADKPYLLLLFKNYATLDEAKAAAQADYEQRIRSALSSSQSDPAPEIAALREENERLRKALEPFAWIAKIIDNCGYEDAEFVSDDDVSFQAGDFRRARAAVAPQQDETKP